MFDLSNKHNNIDTNNFKQIYVIAPKRNFEHQSSKILISKKINSTSISVLLKKIL